MSNKKIFSNKTPKDVEPEINPQNTEVSVRPASEVWEKWCNKRDIYQKSLPEITLEQVKEAIEEVLNTEYAGLLSRLPEVYLKGKMSSELETLLTSKGYRVQTLTGTVIIGW